LAQLVLMDIPGPNASLHDSLTCSWHLEQYSSSQRRALSEVSMVTRFLLCEIWGSHGEGNEQQPSGDVASSSLVDKAGSSMRW